jgi:hypothetical protein
MSNPNVLLDMMERDTEQHQTALGWAGKVRETLNARIKGGITYDVQVERVFHGYALIIRFFYGEHIKGVQFPIDHFERFKGDYLNHIIDRAVIDLAKLIFLNDTVEPGD